MTHEEEVCCQAAACSQGHNPWCGLRAIYQVKSSFVTGGLKKRCTCSMYTAVLLGMSRGMSCSGGGPVDLLPSSLAVRGRILMSSPPAACTSTPWKKSTQTRTHTHMHVEWMSRFTAWQIQTSFLTEDTQGRFTVFFFRYNRLPTYRLPVRLPLVTSSSALQDSHQVRPQVTLRSNTPQQPFSARPGVAQSIRMKQAHTHARTHTRTHTVQCLFLT